MTFINLKPKPSYFIKSISEQGYLLETAIADLIDNSISANASEINIFLEDFEGSPSLFIADDGIGMTDDILIESLRMPSKSLEDYRVSNDLGRFGLGLKTASFSQARKITAISFDQATEKYNGYCWDIANLDDEWNLLQLPLNLVQKYLDVFDNKRNKSQNSCSNKVSTLIIWEQLFREEDIDQLQNYLTFEVGNHLSLVFHRFIDQSDFVITIGNIVLKGFNPFPESMSRLQLVRFYHEDSFTVQGYTLPYTVLKNTSDNNLQEYLIPGRNLSDMEGIYLYRENRLIYYGGWAKLHRRYQYLKLARLMINISNKHDQLFQINVAKSSMQIPKQFTSQIREIVADLGEQSKTVYYQRQPRVILNKGQDNNRRILNKEINNLGVIFTANEEDELYQRLINALDTAVHKKIFNFYINCIVKTLNKYVNYDHINVEEIVDHKNNTITQADIEKLKALGLSDYILKDLID